MNLKLLFIVGMPRSGTTWVSKMFDSHPDTLYLHEPDSVNLLDFLPIIPPPHKNVRLAKYVDSIVDLDSYRVRGKIPVFNKNYYSFHMQLYLHLITYLFQFYQFSGLKYPKIDRVRTKGPIVWKSIESLGRIGTVLRSIENCKAIHIIRHPCGHISSIIRGEQLSHYKEESNADMGLLKLLAQGDEAKSHNLTINKFSKMSRIEVLTWRWILSNEKAINDIRNDKNALTIMYDDICKFPYDNFKKLFQFAGLSWTGQTESFLKKSISKNTDRYYSITKSPLDSSNKWRTELSQDQIKIVSELVNQSSLLTPTIEW
ncbi:MAG: sulfotransferase [Proteobacteria bacterium]|nr:sulfotransferase [Pseudomonadota bacterium]